MTKLVLEKPYDLIPLYSPAFETLKRKFSSIIRVVQNKEVYQYHFNIEGNNNKRFFVIDLNFQKEEKDKYYKLKAISTKKCWEN